MSDIAQLLFFFFCFSKDESLISSLGGALGLYVGIALIMIFELLELLVDIILAIWRYYNAGGKPKKSPDGEIELSKKKETERAWSSASNIGDK